MYQALYRKYRPQTFDEVIGQDVIIKTLKNEILNNKLTHAYLFTGPRGTGKTSVAKILAKTINCENLEGFTPCNSCVSCTQINHKQTTDIIEIDAASNNGVDEIRELKSKVNLVPATSKYKVYIIDEVHMLTVGAFNALLKTLEEPPAHIIFILATTDPHKIPTTILSRCQRYDFKKIGENKIVERLEYITKQENIKIQREALYEIARLSDGGMRDSISMLDQVVSYVDEDSEIKIKDVHDVNGTLTQQEIANLINSIFNHNLEEIFNIFDICNDNGKNFIKLAEEIILFLRNLLLYKIVPNYFPGNNLNHEPYDSLKENVEEEKLFSMIETLNHAINEMKQASNPKMILELSILHQISTDKIPVNVKNTESPKVFEKKEQNHQIVEVLPEIKTNSKQKKEDKIKTFSQTKKSSVHKIFDENKLEELEKIKQIRIGNALSGFQKKEVALFQKKMELLHTYLLDSEYSELVSMILDGNLKAVGNNYLIFIYPTERISNIFNQSLLNIDLLFKNIFHEDYHAIATDRLDWEKIKNEFNNKTKKYQYEEEQIDLESLYKEVKEEYKNEIDSLFGDLVQYE